MTWAVYALACALFYAAFVRLGVVPHALALLAVFRDAGGVMTDPALTDREKEARVRAAALHALAGTAGLVARLAAVAALAALPAFVAFGLSAVTLDALVALSLDPLVLTATIAALVGLDIARRRRAG